MNLLPWIVSHKHQVHFVVKVDDPPTSTMVLQLSLHGEHVFKLINELSIPFKPFHVNCPPMRTALHVNLKSKRNQRK